MSTLTARPPKTQDDRTLFEHAIRVLPRLCEAGAILAVADGMEKAIVVRDMPDGSSSKTAVLDTALAQAFALKAWITCSEQGRISRYRDDKPFLSDELVTAGKLCERISSSRRWMPELAKTGARS